MLKFHKLFIIHIVFCVCVKRFSVLTGRGPCPAEPLLERWALGSRQPHSQYRLPGHWLPFRRPTSRQVCWGWQRESAPPEGSGWTCTAETVNIKVTMSEWCVSASVDKADTPAMRKAASISRTYKAEHESRSVHGHCPHQWNAWIYLITPCLTHLCFAFLNIHAAALSYTYGLSKINQCSSFHN